MTEDGRSKTSRENLEAFIPNRISEEPSVAVATRLPESVVKSLDELRDGQSRAAFLRDLIEDAIESFEHFRKTREHLD